MYNKKTQKDGFGNTRPNLKNSELEQQPTVGVDYLRYKKEGFTFQDFSLLLDLVFPAADYALVVGSFALGKGTRRYSNKYANLQGVQLLFDFVDNPNFDSNSCVIGEEKQDEQLVDFVIDYPGCYLESLGLFKVFMLNIYMIGYDLKCLRFDVAQTVSSSIALCSQDIKTAYKQGNYTGFKEASQISKLDDSEETIYLGSRESSRYIRIYDTLKKHGYEGQRFEVEYKRLKAYTISKKFTEIRMDGNESREQFINRLAKELQSIILAEIDFIDKSVQYSNGSLNNCPRLIWWQDYINNVKGIIGKKIKEVRTPRDIQRTLDWLHRQVSKTLYVFNRGFGTDFDLFIEDLFKNTERRLTEWDKLCISNIQANTFASMQCN